MNPEDRDVSYPAEAWTNADDIELVRRMVDSDETALGALYDQWSRGVYSLVRHLLENPDEAEDVVEETFWEAWRKAPQYAPAKGEVFTWLLTLGRTNVVESLPAEMIASVRSDLAAYPDYGSELAGMEEPAARRNRVLLAEMNRGRSAGIRSRIVMRARAEREARSAPVSGRPDLARGVASLTGLGHRPTPGAQRAVTGETKKVTSSQAVGLPVTSDRAPIRLIIAYAAFTTLAVIAIGAQLIRVSGERRELRDELAAVDTLTPVVDSLETALSRKNATIAMMTGRDVEVIPLVRQSSSEQMGSVMWNRRSNDWIVITHGLRQPREGMVYQVWIVTDYARIPAGTFTPDASGKTMMPTKQAIGRNAFRSIAITEEPEGGTTAPTGPTVATGSR